jgi:hypothetical protein
MISEMNLGTVLIERGLITARQLERVRDRAERTGQSLQAAVVEMGLLSDDEVAEAEACSMGFPFDSLREYDADPGLAHILPRGLAEHYAVVPLAAHKGILTEAMRTGASGEIFTSATRAILTAMDNPLKPSAAGSAISSPISHPERGIPFSPGLILIHLNAAYPSTCFPFPFAEFR